MSPRRILATLWPPALARGQWSVVVLAQLGVLVALVTTVLAAVEVLARRWHLPPETSRKASHVVCGLVVAPLPFLVPSVVVALLGATLAVGLLLVPKQFLGASLHEVGRSSHGEVLYALGVMLVGLLAPSPVHASYGILVLALADAAAALCGVRWGRRQLGRKTWVGSGAFALTASLCALLPLVLLDVTLPGALFLVVVAPVVLAGMEVVSHRGWDNLLVPVAACFLLSAALIV